MGNDSKRAEQAMRESLRFSGFDILHSFSLENLDDSILRSLSIDDSSKKMGYLVGNTGNIWEPFIKWLSQQSKWSEIGDPLETFVEQAIERCTGEDANIFWTHETKRYIVPVQRMAHQTGLAYLSAGQFNIHPDFGPWFALRAVVILPGETAQNHLISNPSTDEIEIESANLFNQLLERQATWQEWLSLRDLYDVGRAHRYTEAQIRYHYTRDRTVLFNEVERLQSPENPE